MKKAVLKNFANVHKDSCRLVTLIKTDFSTDVFV